MGLFSNWFHSETEEEKQKRLDAEYQERNNNNHEIEVGGFVSASDINRWKEEDRQKVPGGATSGVGR